MASLEPHDGGSGQVSTAAQEEAHVVDKLNTWLSVLANLGVVVGIVMSLGVNKLSSFVHLLERHIWRRGNVDKNAFRAMDRDIFEKWA